MPAPLEWRGRASLVDEYFYRFSVLVVLFPGLSLAVTATRAPVPAGHSVLAA